MTTYKPPRIFSQAGFTLVEMMIALVIAALGMTTILVANMGQSQSYNTQLQIAGARQKARATIAMLRLDILTAIRFNAAKANNMILVAQNNNIVTYTWVTNFHGAAIPPSLQRQEITPAGAVVANDIFATGIDGIEFLFNLRNAPPAVAPDPAQLSSITSVTISLVSRADGPDPHFHDRDTYRTKSGRPWVQTGVPANQSLSPITPLNDNFHRRFWQETVVCRNLV